MDDETGDGRRADDVGHRSGPSTMPSAGNGSPPHPAKPDREDQGLRVTPNKNRLLQVRRTGGRKLFDKARKEVFLEWFAATCNASLSAAKAGVRYQTVFKHLAKDPAFFEATQRALQIGYLRLEARSVQEAHSPGFGQDADAVRQPPSTAHTPHPAQAELESPSPRRGEGYEVRVLDDAAAEEHFDPQLALNLLREHRRHLPGPGQDHRKNQRTTARSATNQEIAEALARRLKGFALRVQRQDAGVQDPSTIASSGNGSPPPAELGEE